MAYDKQQITALLREAEHIERFVKRPAPARDIRPILRKWVTRFPVLKEADTLARSLFGTAVLQRGIIEIASHCEYGCLFCGLRMQNRSLQRYHMPREDILAAVDTAVTMGASTIVLQCGQSRMVPAEEIAVLISAIKSRHNVAVTLSLGEHDDTTYRLWRDSGADRYLLKLETTDETLHARLRPGMTAFQRLQHVESLQRMGYETGSGVIVGLPGMTPDILATDLVRLSRMGLEMLAVGPFIPHPDTPLGTRAPGSLLQTLLATALLRTTNPLSNIPATSALDAMSPLGRVLGLHAGANVVMPSYTPDDVRGGYTIYPGKNTACANARDAVLALQQRLQDAGFHMSRERGDSLLRLQRLSSPKPQQGHDTPATAVTTNGTGESA